MGIKQDFGPLTFGFDIGIASVGWAVLSPTQIVDLGVRCFDKAETAKEGESLNLARRTARLTRNRLHQRAWRLKRLSRLLVKEGLVTSTESLIAPRPDLDGAWHLRVGGLDRLLSNDEWARVIYHLCKHRGFYWQSRAEEKKAEGDEKSEGGKVKQGLAKTKALITQKNYRSAAEMVLGEFPDAQRNKHGDYGKALSRILLGDEFKLLFSKQRDFGNTSAAATIERAILGDGDRKSGLFWLQKPPLSGESLLKMIGKCTFEKNEYRAPKASFTAERHVWLTRLTNIRIILDGRTRSLNESEWRTALTLPYESAEKFTYKHLRTALQKLGIDKSFRFTGLSYPSDRQKEDEKAKDPESETLVKLTAWHDLKSLLKKANLESEWQQISTPAVEGKPELLDQIAWILSVYKEDEEAQFELKQLQLPNAAKVIDALLDIRFDKFHSLSLTALNKILPHMEQQLRYDEACEKAGYHHSQLFKVGDGKDKYLPPLYSGRDNKNRMVFNDKIGDIPRNPVVLRSLNQARKVLNALVKKYGSPASVHIEMARDLSKAFDERGKIKKEQEAFRDRNDKDKSTFMSELGIAGAPRGGDFDKWRLYREQMGKCAYSLDTISIERLLEHGYVEIDHALPYSRSFDDSKNNKVLVLARENRNKGNRTPYEYLDGASNSERWRMFVGFVESNKAYRMAKRNRLLRKDFGKEESASFRDRNLNDTRYICKFFKNQVEQFLKLADDSEESRCVVLSGQLTSFLRARWGLIKVRDESDRHHALDAVVVAACSHAMVKRLSDYSRQKELQNVSDGFVDTETGEIINPTLHDKLKAHFPEPWEYFRDEVQVRLKIDDVNLMRIELERIGSYGADALALAKPLFVSRAPMRRSGGAAHKETIYGKHPSDKGAVTEKASLTSLTIKDLDRAIDAHRNQKLYDAIRKRLEAHGGKADKAFTLDNPMRKPDRDGNLTGPIVRTITLVIDKLTGIPVRQGIAKNDTMLRVDVFTKAGKFHLVPVYVHHRGAGLPNRAIVQNKDEDEWTLIDDTFAFKFSLFPNDLVRVVQKNKAPILGYYASCHRGTGNINVWAHDRAKTTGKDGQIEGIGVKTAASIEKFHVDALGNLYPAPLEPSRGLA